MGGQLGIAIKVGILYTFITTKRGLAMVELKSPCLVGRSRFNKSRGLKRLKKALLAKILALVLFVLIPASIAYAQIAYPDVYNIQDTQVYRNVLETGDQLWMVTFDLDYTGANPAERADEAWIVRLMDGAAEVAAVVPNPLHDDGYAPGLVSMYLTPAEAVPWLSANISVVMTGNPTLTWAGGVPPVATDNIVDLWSSSPENITPRIRVIATDFENDWGLDLIELIQGEGKLTSTGEQYFESVVDNLRTIASDLFLAGTTIPEYEERTFTQTAATAAEARWVGDPLLDLTPAATLFGISRLWITSVMYIVGCVTAMIIILTRVPTVAKAGFFLVGAMLVFGSFVGFMAFEVGIFAGILGALAIIYSWFYRPAV